MKDGEYANASAIDSLPRYQVVNTGVVNIGIVNLDLAPGGEALTRPGFETQG
ncbi:hypothetical protein IQ260_26695 [Leptolyngbya cf. ectocarpi LEGE 11479]|uniref:Uncharacterized protein n=1 Tax=Leptolyngbya cf. ectocarpi LEGE 11479 TaxID=1828722 RepID=A0A929FA74_LEPEC|nr:hypothetical protein [Leptolyngbya ectocarpi]MBE9070235.1 hypothetical protein [Leptolyngbya cf. ectocarpi LEGE 11479]